MKTRSIQKVFASFQPRSYLREYYKHIGQENEAILTFLHKGYKIIFSDLTQANILEFGGGPTIYQLISAAQYPVTIDFSDYLEQNLKEIRSWMQKKGKFSWKKYIHYILKLEGIKPTLSQIHQREALLRSKIKHLVHCDARNSKPLDQAGNKQYDILSVHFVPESITQSHEEWRINLKHILTLLRPGGYFVQCSIIGAIFYRAGTHFFPATPITEALLHQELRRHRLKILVTDFVEGEHVEEWGYQGIAMILAQKH